MRITICGRYHTKWGVQMMGMNFQTCSRAVDVQINKSSRDKIYGQARHFVVNYF